MKCCADEDAIVCRPGERGEGGPKECGRKAQQSHRQELISGFGMTGGWTPKKDNEELYDPQLPKVDSYSGFPMVAETVPGRQNDCFSTVYQSPTAPSWLKTR